MTDIMTLGQVATYINGRAFKPSEWEGSGLPIIRIQNLTESNKKYNYSTRTFEEKFRIQNDDLLFAWSASLGAFIWKGGEAWLNQHIFKVEPKPFIQKRYLYYFLLYVIADLYAKTHGSGMVHITKGPFMATPIHVPSLPAQKHIAEKIDELFDNLDAAEAELRIAKEKLNIFRLTVLDQAFSGKLSTFNRNDNIDELIQQLSAFSKNRKHFSVLEPIPLPSLPEDWRWICVGDISTGVEYGSAQKSSPNGEVPVIRMGNIQKGRIDYDDLVYSSDNAEIAKYTLHSGDVLFNRTNSPELVGKTGIYLGEQPAIFAGYLIRLNHIQNMVDSKYLNYFLNSNIAIRYGNKVKGTSKNSFFEG